MWESLLSDPMFIIAIILAVGGSIGVIFAFKNMTNAVEKTVKIGNTCFTCEKVLTSSEEKMVYTFYSVGLKINKWICKNCAQKQLDIQGGVCPLCKKPLKWNDSMAPRLDSWYHSQCAYIMDRGGGMVNTEITNKVVVKIRCPYCKHTYDETLNKCSHCGAGHA